MRIRTVIIILLTSYCAATQAQTVDLEFATGMFTGWWIFDKGMSDSIPGYHEGYDRSHLSTMAPARINLIYSGERWSVGTQLGYLWLNDKELVSSVRFPDMSLKYDIAENALHFIQYGFQGEYTIAKGRNYQFRFHLSAGSFAAFHNHPDKEDFGTPYFWMAGITNEFDLGKIKLVLRPEYSNLRLTYRTSNPNGKRNNVYYFGAGAGIRVPLTKHKPEVQ